MMHPAYCQCGECFKTIDNQSIPSALDKRLGISARDLMECVSDYNEKVLLATALRKACEKESARRIEAMKLKELHRLEQFSHHLDVEFNR